MDYMPDWNGTLFPKVIVGEVAGIGASTLDARRESEL
jgi:hypothetical protein